MVCASEHCSGIPEDTTVKQLQNYWLNKAKEGHEHVWVTGIDGQDGSREELCLICFIPKPKDQEGK